MDMARDGGEGMARQKCSVASCHTAVEDQIQVHEGSIVTAQILGITVRNERVPPLCSRVKHLSPGKRVTGVAQATDRVPKGAGHRSPGARPRGLG
jgi:hypothetical protein